jgi:N-acylneuraminate cytidylyltransferase
MNNLAIIPARGGSKRIPRKNIKDFLGKPIISYSIEIALNSNLFNQVMVSTDDEEIAETAIKYGATVPFFRSKLNSNDYSTTMDVVQEVRMEYLAREICFDNICCIYPTAPLIKINDLIDGYNLLLKNNNDIVYPITEFSYPILRSLFIDKEGDVKMKWPEFENTRSQDLDKFYHDCGQWYWYTNISLQKNNFIKKQPIILENSLVQDIDNYNDWKLAELKYRIYNNLI